MNFQRPQIEEAFNAVVAAVNVVAQEKVSRASGWITSNLEELHQVVVLAMDVATDGNGRIYFQEGWFGMKNLGALFDNEQSLILGKTPLSIEVLFEKLYIGLLVCLVMVEFLVGRCQPGGGRNIYEDVEMISKRGLT